MNTGQRENRIPRLAPACPQAAMVLAAGKGTRMLPITENTPKPLVPVRGKPLVDYALDAAQSAGARRIVVNVHHLADQMEAHLAGSGHSGIAVSDERECLLDSGGGVAKALPLLGDAPFYLLNADSFWVEGYRPNLAHLHDHWRDDAMDILLLTAGMENSVGYAGLGDFFMDADGRLKRRMERHVAPFVYAGAAIIHPRVFTDVPDGPFSLNLLFDRAIEQERMYGIRLDGLWLHVGTPQAIHEAEQAIARSAA